MEIDPGESNRGAQKRMLEQIVATPATLFFPASIVTELNEICETLGYTPQQLVVEALKRQVGYWEEFYEYVITTPENAEDFIWPEDPIFCLACVAAVHFIKSFTLCSHDPVALAELKEHAPAEWSFCSLEDKDQIDAADWWKELN
jgi:hypothetical protein